MYVIVCVYVLYIHCIYINITKKVSVLCIYIYLSIYLSIYPLSSLHLHPQVISPLQGYNAAITSTSRSGQWSVALSFFDVMPSKDPVP